METVPRASQLPPLPVLIERLHAVEVEIQGLQAKLSEPLADTLQRTYRTHIRILQRRKAWYVARIRREKPVEPLDLGVADAIRSGEAAG